MAEHPGIDLVRLRQLFLEEAHEHAEALESGVLAMEHAPNDAQLVNDVFRAAHSLKGAAGSIGFVSLAELTHALETLLDAWRSKEIEPTRRHVDTLLRSCDAIRRLLANGAELAGAASLTQEWLALKHDLEALSELGVAAPRAAPNLTPAPSASSFCIHFAPQPEAFECGSDPMLVLRELGTLSSRLVVTLQDSGLPPLETLNATSSYLAWDIELELLAGLDRAALDEAFSFVEALAEIRIEARKNQGSADRPASNAPAARRPEAEPKDVSRVVPHGDAATIRVATDKVDKLVDLVGELVIAHSAVRELSRNVTAERLALLQEAVLETERHLRELQERVMSIRMVSVGNIFSRLPRLVREVTTKLGKEVHLELDGGDTELDKGLAERLGDPLLHLVRNALDHGLETPAERVAAGKPSAGILRVSARPRGGSVVVEVSDDGRGLNRQKILSKAIERGLVSSDVVLSDDEVNALISLPGFSTADAVTDLSGRGVGLDVVKRNVEALGGDLSIRSVEGRGSTFEIRLPLTLTIMEGLLLQAGDTVCVVPLVDVAFSLRLRPEQQRSLAGLGEVLDLPSESLPLLDLAHLMGHRSRETGGQLSVVVQTGAFRYALKVDGLIGQTQVVVKSLETNFKRVPGILGATILGDGRVALILDGSGLAMVAGLDRTDCRAIAPRGAHGEASWN